MIRGGSLALRRWAAWTPRWRVDVSVLALYILLAVIIIDHGVNVTTMLSGEGMDPVDDIWFLSWWPYALTHHLDPLFTHLVWQPVGVCLGWVTSVPALSILVWPITVYFGPVLSYNLLIMTAPALSAWCAYLLFRHVTASVAAAIVGGVFFGFSNYAMAQDGSALNLAFTASLPLLCLYSLRRITGLTSRSSFVIALTLVLSWQFYIAIELFAFEIIFGIVALLFALLYLDTYRPSIFALFLDIGRSAPLVVLLCAPLLLSMWVHRGLVHHPDVWPRYFDADFLEFLTPGRAIWWGQFMPPSLIRFNGGVQEQDCYLGLPAIALCATYGCQNGTQGVGRWLVVMVLGLSIASLGPVLWVDGIYTNLPLPWGVVVGMPLIGEALPTRFALFTSLAVASILVLWVSRPGRPALRVICGLVACIVAFPALHPWMPIPHSRFFNRGNVEAVLGQNRNLLVLPFAIQGPSSAWQAEEGFGFAQTAGYLGFPPKPMQQFAAVPALFGQVVTPALGSEIATFVQAAKTDFIVIGPGTSPRVTAALATLHWPTRHVDDVTILTVPHG
jgi:hypothetical protein